MKIITVHKGTSRPVINSIIQPQHLPTNESIIPINQHSNFPSLTMVMYGIVYIIQCKDVLLVYDDFNFLGRNLFLLYVCLDILSCQVGWGVIYVYYVVVVVVLHENWVQVAKIKSAVDVLVRWSDQAEGQLWVHVLQEWVFRVIQLFLGIQDLFYLQLFLLVSLIIRSHLYLNLTLKINIMHHI